MSQQVIFVWLWVSTALAAISDDHLYCALRYKRLCQGKGRHVGCEFPEVGPGRLCENYTTIKFTDDLKHFITHYINRRRQRIASGVERVRGGIHLPKPELMMSVEWDRELAQLAQRLADQCRFVHDDCRATVRYPYPGQTVGEVRWRKFSDSDESSAQQAIRRVFDAWWGERRRVTPNHLTTPFKLTTRGGAFGHFTQLAVWTLRAVGCAAVRHGMTLPRLLLVCDFSHTNMLGQRTIVPGPLKQCPEHTTRRPRSAYPLLCAPVRRLKQNVKDIVPVTLHSIDDEQDADIYNRDEEDDADEDVNVDTAKVEKSSIAQTSQERTLSTNGEEYFRFKNEGFQLQAGNIKTVPKNDVIMDKLERELQVKKEQQRIKESSVMMYRKTTKLPFINRVREDEEDSASKTKKAYLRKTVPVVTQAVAFDVPTSRPRWKPARQRPKRPGAKALLISSTETTVPHGRKSFVAPLMLDKEDVDQLYRDTGFKTSKNKDRH